MWYTCRICLFGLLETERRNQITVIGNTVNLASRLEKIATNDEIIVSEKVRNITQSQFEFESMKIEEKIKKKKSSYLKMLKVFLSWFEK